MAANAAGAYDGLKDECPICLMPLENYVSRLECGHVFHKACVDQMRKHLQIGVLPGLQQSTAACPLCRAPLDAHVDASELACEVRNVAADADRVIAAARALGQLGDRGASHATVLAERLTDSNVNLRRVAAWALGQLSSEAVAPHAPALAECLGDVDTGVRYCATNILARMGEPGVVALFNKAIKSGVDRGDGKANALRALKNTGYLGAKVLADQLESSDPVIRQQAVAALGQFEAAGSFAAKLVSCLSDAHPGVRSSAATSLGRIRRHDAEPHVAALSALLKDNAPGVQGAAAEALGRIGRPSLPYFEDMVHILENPRAEATVQAQVVEAIGKIGTACLETNGGENLVLEDDALASMSCLVINPDDDVRNNTIGALTSMGLIGAAVLASQLKQTDVGMRGSYVEALRKMGQTGAAGFGGALMDSDAVVRRVAATALGRMGEEAMPHINQLTLMSQADPDPAGRQAAQSALTYICEGPKVVITVDGPTGEELAAIVATQITAIRAAELSRKPMKKRGLFSCCRAPATRD